MIREFKNLEVHRPNKKLRPLVCPPFRWLCVTTCIDFDYFTAGSDAEEEERREERREEREREGERARKDTYN